MQETPVLGPNDPSPVEVLNRNAQGPFVFGCEHAGNAVPESLGTLGLSAIEMTQHIAWDIGAASLTRCLSDASNSPAVLQRYSRLVYDCNRTKNHPDAFVVDADGSHVAANKNLSDAMRAAREREIYRPFQGELTEVLEMRRRASQRFAYVAIHSFNEKVGGQQRPWHVGFIFNQQPSMSHHLIHWLKENTDYAVGDNAPYSPLDAVDHTIRVQAEVRDIPYTMIEVRNDLLRDETGIAHWADLLSRGLKDFAGTQLR